MGDPESEMVPIAVVSISYYGIPLHQEVAVLLLAILHFKLLFLLAALIVLLPMEELALQLMALVIAPVI